jgi:hypothetical protein
LLTLIPNAQNVLSMKKYFIVFCLHLFVFVTHSQVEYCGVSIDTIKLSHRTGGDIDSVDLANSYLMTNIPGNGFSNQMNYYTPSWYVQHEGFQNFRSNHKPTSLKFSALPHLGFAYSFGAKSTQFLHVDYQQAFSEKVLLNINYDKFSSNGFMPNSASNQSLVGLKLRVNDRRVYSLFSADYGSQTVNQSGGMFSDSTLEYIGLDFVNTYKNNALSEMRNASFDLLNYFTLSKDSSNLKYGIYTEHSAKVYNRKYTESGLLDTLYSSIYIDSNRTNDQYQLANYGNKAGVYIKNNRLYAGVGGYHDYWNYQNLGLYKDTHEFNLEAKIKYTYKGISFENNFSKNIIGAKGGWIQDFKMNFKYKKFNMEMNSINSNTLVQPFQRFYYSNNQSYLTNFLELQRRSSLRLKGRYQVFNTLAVLFGLETIDLENNYFFLNDKWDNDSIPSIQNQLLNIGLDIKFKNITIQPKLYYSNTSMTERFMPQFIYNARVVLKGKAFKAKRLAGFIGVDLSYASAHNVMGYNPSMDLYLFPESPVKNQDLFLVHAFMGIEISEFRFYARFENANYFSNVKSNQVLENYVIPSNILRLGLTWDFFN